MQTTSTQDQVYSAFVDNINVNRIKDEIINIDLQDACFVKAMEDIENVRNFIGQPEKILGSPLTKHGEIAEQVEVGVRNARDVLEGRLGTATFDNVGRLAPEDYLINDVAVQSKFINGAGNNLSHVIKHMDQYESFGRDGSYYHIPKDHYEIIDKIRQGESVNDFNERTLGSIRKKIEEIEAKSGKPFNEVVRPGVSDYAEVQQGKIVETLDNHEKSLEQRNEEIKDSIRDKHRPSLNEGLRAAGVAAAVGGALSLGSSLYIKHKKENKNVFKGEFNSEDWKEIGLNTLKGTVVAGVTGGAVYALTNCASLSAPLAGAFVTATKGISSLTQDFYQGNLTFDEFQLSVIFLCVDSAGVGLATVAGQTMIPIPVLGAVVGALAGKIACKILFDEDKKLAKQMEISMQKFTDEIDKAYQSVVDKINFEFDKIADLRLQAFDINSNVSIIESSILLANAYGVEEDKILKNESDLHSFLFD